MPGIRHNGGIDWDILILQLIYKKTLKDKTPGETCVSFSLPGTLVIDLCHMISLGQWCLMKISSDLKTTSLADLQKFTYHWDTMNLENEFVYQGYNML